MAPEKTRNITRCNICSNELISDPESSNPFLPDPPIVAMELGHINPSQYMIGYTDKEGIWSVKIFVQ